MWHKKEYGEHCSDWQQLVYTFEISELKGIGIIKAFETWRWSSVPFISQHFWQQHFVIQKYTTAVTTKLKKVYHNDYGLFDLPQLELIIIEPKFLQNNWQEPYKEARG